ncbi:MAG: S8 family serine peptidase, partial [Chloroflexota bacterium]|nr:S8 family serine peptidase [Chloroflexota bacterium]
MNVDVAVLDTGSGPHGDLNVVGGKDCTGTGSYNDDHGHGTHVAGTIGAIDNSIGVVGMVPGARIWSVKVLGANGSGYGSWILCGIDWVTANAGTIDVANMSLGGITSYRDDNNCGYTNGDAIHRAICKSVDAGVTYVVAAGNDAADAVGYFPAQYDEVITTSALSTSDTLASFSNYGPDVDVIAPGVSVTSTAMGGGYATMSGTSMASPHAAGAAALYKVTNPGASPSTVRSALISTGSSSVWSGDKDSSKEALINVSTFGVAPITHDAQVVSVSAPSSVTQGTTATVTVAVKNNGSASELISVALSESPGDFSQTQSVTVGAGASVNVPFTWVTTLSTVTGAHTFTATATVADDSNTANNTGTATTTVATAVSTATMSVTDMTLASAAISGGYQLSSTVTIQSSGAAVSGADVTIEYTDPNGTKTSQTASTNTSGLASFSRNVTATGTYTVTVTTVTQTGASYDASKNAVSQKNVAIQAATTSNAMYVSSMTLSSSKLSSGYRLSTRVYIQTNGAKVSGASVAIRYTYPNGSTVSATATTNTYGYASFTRSVTALGAYSVTVTNVTKSGSTYDASKNAVTSKSVSVGSTSTGGTMSVSSLTLSPSTVTGGYKLTTNVTIVSGTTKISGASVTVKYTDPNGSTTSQTATTNTSGIATFSRTVSASGAYTVSVTGVSKSGSTYDASKNAVTSKSITVGSTSTGSEASCLSTVEAAFLKLV